ncbi:MAG TPA: hypothetical protein P5307_07955, partial [Pirellulaceae bacterium]|nr:hypothetical protein [Pirellulaceae bacterium]
AVEDDRRLEEPPQDGRGDAFTSLNYMVYDGQDLSTRPFGNLTIDIEPAEAEIGIRLETVNAAGEVVSSVPVGSSFSMNVYVEDRQQIPTGLFSAYMTMYYSSDFIQATQIRHNSPIYTSGLRGTIVDPFSVVGLGGFASTFDPVGGGEILLLSIDFTATAMGSASLRTGPVVDEQSFVGFTRFGEDTRAGQHLLDFPSATLDIVANANASSSMAPSSSVADKLQAPLASQHGSTPVLQQGIGAEMDDYAECSASSVIVSADPTMIQGEVYDSAYIGETSIVTVKLAAGVRDACYATIEVVGDDDAYDLGAAALYYGSWRSVGQDGENRTRWNADVLLYPSFPTTFEIIGTHDEDHKHDDVEISSGGASATVTVLEPNLSRITLSSDADAREPSQWFKEAGNKDGRFVVTRELTPEADPTQETTVTFRIDATNEKRARPEDYSLSARDENGQTINWDSTNPYQLTFAGDKAYVIVVPTADPPDQDPNLSTEKTRNEPVTLQITQVSSVITNPTTTIVPNPYAAPDDSEKATVTIQDREELVIRATQPNAEEQGPKDGYFVVEPAESGEAIHRKFTLKIDASFAGAAVPGADYSLFRINPGFPPTEILFKAPSGGFYESSTEIDPRDQDSVEFMVRPTADGLAAGASGESILEIVRVRIKEIEAADIQDDLTILDHDATPNRQMPKADLQVPESDAADCSCSCTVCAADGIFVELQDGSLGYIPASTNPYLPQLRVGGTHSASSLIRAELTKPTDGWPTQIWVSLLVVDDNDTEENPTRTRWFTLSIPSSYSKEKIAFTVPAEFPSASFTKKSYDIMLEAFSNLDKWTASESYLIRDLRTAGALAPSGVSDGGVSGEDSSLAAVVPGATLPFLKSLSPGQTRLDDNGDPQEAVALFRGDNSASWYLLSADGQSYERPPETLSELAVVAALDAIALQGKWSDVAASYGNPPEFVFALTDRFGSVDYFDGFGRQVMSVDTNENATVFHYDTSGRLRHIIDPRLRTTTFDFDSKGRLRSVTDFANQVTSFSYSGGTLTITHPDPDDGGSLAAPQEVITFDAQGLILSANRTEDKTDGASRLVTVDYDSWGRVDSVIRHDLTTRQSLTASDLSTWSLTSYAQKQALPNPVTWSWLASTAATVENFDAFVNEVVVEDGRGNETSYRLDSRGRTLDTTDAMMSMFYFNRKPVTA